MNEQNVESTKVLGWVEYVRDDASESLHAPERSAEHRIRLNHDRLIDGSGLPYLGRYVETYEKRSDRTGYKQLVADAQVGKFSHLAIAHINEFGATDAKIQRGFDTLVSLGITIRIATYPSLDPADPDGRTLIDVLLLMVRYEAARTARRVHEGMIRKRLSAL
jgi:DNA invertase Pin-like site-specific DNA recombinase